MGKSVRLIAGKIKQNRDSVSISHWNLSSRFRWLEPGRCCKHLPGSPFLDIRNILIVNNVYLKFRTIVSMPRGRPELYPIKKLIRFDQKMLDDIDEWRRHQTPIPTVTDAIRTLIEHALATAPKRRPAKRKGES